MDHPVYRISSITEKFPVIDDSSRYMRAVLNITDKVLAVRVAVCLAGLWSGGKGMKMMAPTVWRYSYALTIIGRISECSLLW